MTKPQAAPEPVGAAPDGDASEAGATQQRPVQDLEHPWLGLESFREDTRGYFFGREAEIGELHLRLRSHPLLVLYGRSGLGKTSILRAGLIPRLRADKDKKRPLLIRLRYDDPALDPTGQLVAAVFGWAEHRGLAMRPTKSLLWVQRLGDKLGVSLPEDHACRLWLRLHFRGEAPDITHLFLDQFEEVFTLGRQIPGAEDAVRDMMAILLQGAIPEAITRLIAEHDPFLDHFDPDSVPVRVILALRDDYVYALNRWGRHLPALGQNHFELRALRGPAAFEAVFKPGALRCRYRADISNESPVETGLPPIIDADTAERIVRFIAEKGADVPLADIEAVPPILSLLCRELNQRRFIAPDGSQSAPAPRVTFDESDAEIGTIIAAFYERCLAGRPEAVRIFIEEHLVSYSGARLAQDEQSILRVFESGCEIPGTADHRHAAGFGESDAARACLNELITQRLLSPLNDQRYELIHDLLAQVVDKSRISRIQRLDKEEADRRAERERRAKDAAEQQAHRARRQLLTVRVLLLVSLVAIALGGWQSARAARAAREREAAEKQLGAMGVGVWSTLVKLGQWDALQAVKGPVEDYYRTLAGREASPEVQRLWAVMLDLSGDVEFGQEKDEGKALAIYRQSLTIRQSLVSQDPGNADWQHDLAVSYANVGNMLNVQLDLAGTLESYQRSLDLWKTLARQDPLNVDWQRDLSLSYERVGDVQGPLGNLTGALESYRASIAIRQTLARQAADNPERQRDLAVGYERLGDAQSGQDNPAAALESYRASLAIREALAQPYPDDVTRQADFAVVSWRTGMTLLRAEPRSRTRARALVRKGGDILRQLNQRGILPADQQESLKTMQADLLNWR